MICKCRSIDSNRSRLLNFRLSVFLFHVRLTSQNMFQDRSAGGINRGREHCGLRGVWTISTCDARSPSVENMAIAANARVVAIGTKSWLRNQDHDNE